MSSNFEGRVALITGSGRGIGRAIAIRFAKSGADIVVNFFRNRGTAEETAQEIRMLGRKAHVVKANIGDLDDLDRLILETEKVYGRLDMLIHNAASGYNRPVLEQRPKGWDWTLNINARSFLFGAQRAASLMQAQGGGSIIAISSLGSSRVLPNYVTVGASKAALEALVRYLAVEFAPMNIGVNAISPGLVKTDALKHFQLSDDSFSEKIEIIAARTPVGRLCTPEDVAEIALFLCRQEAKMVCGQVIVVDGGYSLQEQID